MRLRAHTVSILRAVALFTVLAAVLPLGVSAAPPEDRTPGLHRFQWQVTTTFFDGTTDSFVTDNAITISTTAPVYDNVLLRLVRNWGLLPDGTTVFDVSSMRPDQEASFYAQSGSSSEEASNVSSVVMLIRYETTKNHWSAWFAASPGPEASGCVQTTNGVIRRTYGWAG